MARGSIRGRTPAPTTNGEIDLASVADLSAGAGTATHIVLFREASETNVRAMSSAMSLRSRASASLAGVMEMAGSEAGVASVAVYEDLGVATVAGTPEEIERLRSLDEVEEVFPNEVRTIPTPVSDAALAPDNARPELPHGVDYLRGLRDGLDIALARLTGERREDIAPAFAAPDVEASRAFADTAQLTWGLQAIGVNASTRLTGRGIRVAVLDTGIDTRHLDFAGRLATNRMASFIPNESVQDANGHGTHCSGTVAGPARPRSGPRYGVAPEAELWIGKVLSNAGRGNDQGIINGIQWAATNGVRVISMSLGSRRAVGAPYNNLYERIAERLLRPRTGLGCLLIAAAGNDSRRPSSRAPVGNPAAAPSIMAVAAVDSSLRVASFSCAELDGIGRLEISGPGVAVLSARSGGGTTALNGTSMACPHVAGVATLYMQARPNLSAAAAWDQLIQSARRLGTASDFGAGLVQVPGASARSPDTPLS